MAPELETEVVILVGALLTVSDVDPVTPPSEAETVVSPGLADEQEPPAQHEATVVSDDDHVAWYVMSAVEPSEYVPVAWNCMVVTVVVVPTDIVGFAGDTEIELRTFTVSGSHVLVAAWCQVPP